MGPASGRARGWPALRAWPARRRDLTVRHVPRIKAAYDRLIEAYLAQVATAMAAGDTGTVTRVEETRDTLERGVFVLLFGQLEMRVTEYFEQARNARAANPDWRSRRG